MPNIRSGVEQESKGGFDPFFRRTFPALARSSALIVGEFSLGEEIAQESFTRVLERWDSMESEEHARRFAFKVAVNLARSHLRRSWRLQALSSEHDRPAPDVIGVSETLVALEHCLRRLSPRQRAVLVLVDYAGYPVHEAADLLGVRPPTARVHLSRARAAVRADIGFGLLADEHPAQQRWGS